MVQKKRDITRFLCHSTTSSTCESAIQLIRYEQKTRKPHITDSSQSSMQQLVAILCHKMKLLTSSDSQCLP